MKPTFEDVDISYHAAKRWFMRKRARSARSARDSFQCYWERAKPVFLTSKWRVNALLNHNYADTAYYKSGPYVFVLIGSKIVTVFVDRVPGRFKYNGNQKNTRKGDVAKRCR